jgi:predicted amidohydrolase
LGMTGGSQIKTFDTDCGKIGIHDLLWRRIPELSRLLDEGMNILFVPS